MNTDTFLFVVIYKFDSNLPSETAVPLALIYDEEDWRPLPENRELRCGLCSFDFICMPLSGWRLELRVLLE